MTTPTTIDIGWLQLTLATGFMLVTGMISILLALGLTRDLLISTLRTYLQLLLLGYVLNWIFAINTAQVVVGVLAFMLLIAVQILLQRVNVNIAIPILFANTLIAITLSSTVVTFTVTGAIIQVSPWYEARYVLAMGGMIIGNSMNGIAVALERLFDDMRKRRAEITQILALGGTPWEAALPSIRTALAAGLTPTINSMNAVGLVFIPGMMTGQLLAGADPIQAAKYQIIVMLMLSAATTLGAMCGVFLLYGKMFDKEMRLRE